MKDAYMSYPGHYEFQFSQTEDGISCAWVWIPDPPKETKSPARARQAFAGYKYS